MRLEDEIKTRQFRSEEHKLTVNIIYTFNWLHSRNSKVFKDFDLTSSQYNVLRILRGQLPNTCTIQLLKERVLDKQPDISRLIDRLYQKGLVIREVSPADRRKVDLSISQEGLELLKRIDPIVEEQEKNFESLNQSEIVQLNTLLDRLRDSR